MIFVLVPLMFFVAIIFSMLGLGGGVLYTPIQIWVGVDFHEAATTALFLIMVVSISASIVFRRAHRIDWPLAMTLESVTIVGGFMGGYFSSSVPHTMLTLLLSFVIALAGLFMVRPVRLPAESTGRPTGRFQWTRRLGERVYHVNLATAFPLSFVAGVISGLVGVGGGFLKIPMMVLLFGIPMEIAIGSSAFMIGITAAGGFVGHACNGHWNWRWSMVLAVAVFLGGQIGSRISVGLREKQLKRGFGWFLLLIALFIALRLKWS